MFADKPLTDKLSPVHTANSFIFSGDSNLLLYSNTSRSPISSKNTILFAAALHCTYKGKVNLVWQRTQYLAGDKE